MMRMSLLLPSRPFPPVGGGIVYEYANQLVRRGHQVTVVHLRRLGAFPHHPYKLVRRLASLMRLFLLGPRTVQ